jgi:hypothetical protein
MVPGIRIEVTAIRIAGAITTDGGIGIVTLETAWRYKVEQPVSCAVHQETSRLRSLGYTLASLVSSDQLQREDSQATREGIAEAVNSALGILRGDDPSD